MPWEIRAARHGEEDDVLRMYEWLFATPGRKPADWDPEAARARLERVIAAPDALALVAADGHALIGLCVGYIDIESVRFGQRCWVEDLAVHPKHRSGGVGAALLEAARVWAIERGATHFELDTALGRVDAHRFYDRQPGEAHKGYSYSWRL